MLHYECVQINTSTFLRKCNARFSGPLLVDQSGSFWVCQNERYYVVPSQELFASVSLINQGILCVSGSKNFSPQWISGHAQHFEMTNTKLFLRVNFLPMYSSFHRLVSVLSAGHAHTTSFLRANVLPRFRSVHTWSLLGFFYTILCSSLPSDHRGAWNGACPEDLSSLSEYTLKWLVCNSFGIEWLLCSAIKCSVLAGTWMDLALSSGEIFWWVLPRRLSQERKLCALQSVDKDQTEELFEVQGALRRKGKKTCIVLAWVLYSKLCTGWLMVLKLD